MTSLILLAAGASKRFGRPKQLEPVGPHGEAIMDITMRHAFAGGCDEARLVVRPDHAEHFRMRYREDDRIRILEQSQPLGTGHATLVGMEHAADTCIVANGDDLYGEAAMRLAIRHAREGFPEENALVAFALGNTLSPNGPVNRAVCRTTAYHLVDTQEVAGLVAMDGGIRDADGRKWDPGTLVSMNLWVFRTEFELGMHIHWRDRDPQERSEFGLPTAVREAIRHEQVFRVLRTDARWAGLTYAADADLVRRTLAEGNS